MKTKYYIASAVFLLTTLLCQTNDVRSEEKKVPFKSKSATQYEAYKDVVNRTVAMVNNTTAYNTASKYGLQILNLTWEDTGRYHNSSVGPNISDMTIQVQLQDPKTQQYQLYCMPVIRFPNFSDKTCDVRTDKFFLLVGNEKGQRLTKVNLRDFLKDLRKYLANPSSWKGSRHSLLAQRDTHVLVSAQACFLPIPKNGDATFNPVLFNYQSYSKNPAVLTILVTREGTSVTIIDNQRDVFQAGSTWGQRLFFNQKGERSSLTGKRLSDFLKENKKIGKQNQNQQRQNDDTAGLNMVLLIQVPLKQKPIQRYSKYSSGMMDSMPSSMECSRASSNVENAVIGHGKVEGPFTEIDNLTIERDTRFPVRVTVQFYKATSNGVVSEKDMADIAKQINKVYSNADYVGSLVLDGKTGRPTEHDGPMTEPPGWWNDFWTKYEQEHKQPKEKAIEMLRHLLGPGWRPSSREELENQLNEAKGKEK